MPDHMVDPARAITPLDVSDASIFVEDSWQEPFRHMRRYMPISYRLDSPYGPYWSVATLDLIQEVELNPEIFASAVQIGGIAIVDPPEELWLPNFIAADAPIHTAQRKVVQPAFNPSEMNRREAEIRQRTKELFDELPIGETFDWVERVSIELTIGMLSILFDFPWEERLDMKRWSDWTSEVTPDQSEERRAEFMVQMTQMLTKFDELFDARRNEPPADDLFSRMVHSEAMGNMEPMERVANVALLIVGGNDTTRNSMSGFVHACHLFPDQFDKLRADPSLIPNAAQETIRWQSPVTHMRRTCTQDTILGGQKLSKGDKVILWYISANHDDNVFPLADQFDVTRKNARRHVAFGHGVHRCVGARLAEIQLAVLFEEILSRGVRIEEVAEPTRLASPFLHGFTEMPVRMVPIE